MIWSAETPRECLFCFFFINRRLIFTERYAVARGFLRRGELPWSRGQCNPRVPNVWVTFAVVLGCVQKNQAEVPVLIGMPKMCQYFFYNFWKFSGGCKFRGGTRDARTRAGKQRAPHSQTGRGGGLGRILGVGAVLGVGVTLGVPVGVAVGESVAVGVAVGVAVAVAVDIGVVVAVAVDVAVAVAVAVAVDVAVAVAVGEVVAVGVGVAPPDGDTRT